MIAGGGHILDVGAVRQLAVGGPYMIARIVVASRDAQALYVPATALAAGLAGLPLDPRRRETIEDALGAPCFTYLPLDRDSALAVAELATGAGVDIAVAHVAHAALRRPGLPVLTDRPAELHKVYSGIAVEELP